MRLLIALLATTHAFKQQRDDNKPRGKRNVLFMIADDLRPQLGHLGHSDVDTPQIDRLAKTGVSFRRAYCQAPACNPSRNSFLTGMYPDVSKVFYFEGVTHLTLGKRGELDVFSHMRSHGYITMGVGKLWHWEPIGEPFTRGTGAHFPKWGTYSQEWGCGDEDSGGRCSPRKEEVPDGDIVMGRVYPTKDPAESLFDYRVASDANKKLALGAKQWSMRRRPFFLGVGFHHPHTKWRVPVQTWSQYQDRRIAMPEITRKTRGAPFYAFGDNNIAPTAITIDGTHYKVPAKPYKEGKELPVSVVRELRRGYLASVAFLDVQVGRVLDQVDALHLSNDTVIIFTSDHGYGIGERGHWGKGSLYEIDARVPLIVRDPHHRHMWGRSTNALVELVDLYKSVIDLAHLPFGRHMYQWLEGRSWRSIVETGQGGNSHALTIVPKCYGKKYGDAPPHNCGGRSYEWHRMEGGTKTALVGFAARSHRYRYVAWMDHNESLDAVDWARAPVAEELYDNSKMDERDLDSSDALNLLSASAGLSGVEWADIRDKADAHLRWLRQSARDRFFRAFGEYHTRLHDQSDVVKEFLPSHARPAAMPPRDPPAVHERTPRKKPRFSMMGRRGSFEGGRARRRQEWGRV